VLRWAGVDGVLNNPSAYQTSRSYWPSVLDALEALESQTTQDASERGQIAETGAAIVSLKKRLDEVRSQFVADQANKLADAERRREQLAQEFVKAASRAERTRLTAPIAGTVQQLSITTIGQVVAAGQPLATIVPVDAAVEVEVMVLNQDIGFVSAGQEAVVKVEAFPFTRYGTLKGTVKRVSTDAVAQGAAGAANDPVSALNSANGAQAAAPQTFVFPATIALETSAMQIDGKRIPLSPGMAVTIEIKTGERRVIDYLLSPLREIASGTAHER
jgi:hemolysin D